MGNLKGAGKPPGPSDCRPPPPVNAPRPIRIVGGGLAGLSLGLALQRQQVPVTVYEAGEYPRHRVCGEFIAGLRERTIEALGLGPFLVDALQHRSVLWSRKGEPVREQFLARPAFGVSRHTLDLRLAEAFAAAGGTLETGRRVELDPAESGVIFASGRVRTRSRWLGLKVHASGFRLERDLEFHLGNRAYVGLCAVAPGVVNVCGLFRRRPGLQTSRSTALLSYLEAAGLNKLAGKLLAARIDEASCSAVAGFGFDLPSPASHPPAISLGDAFAMIPPFTGNGMAMAFQSAETAAAPLLAWARGAAEWPETVRVTTEALRRRFSRRLYIASKLHPFLLHPARQSLFNLANRTGLLPVQALSSALHSL